MDDPKLLPRRAFVCLALASSISIASAEPTGARSSGTAVSCASTDKRVECAADTSRGVVLQRTTSAAACILGTSWGYDAGTIWVKNGCAGEFGVGDTAPPGGDAKGAPPAPSDLEGQPRETWGAVEPGKGFLVGKTSLGELYISAYALFRYLNQMTTGGTFTDHLGVEHPIDARHDIWAHRIMLHLKGWLGTPKLIYQITLWTVNPTDQKALFGVLGYQFTKRFNLYAGLNGIPGSRSLMGSHPYWLGHDRVMADEFFRPYFTHGVWANGELLPGLWYAGMIGNNLSTLGITAAQLTRNMAYGASVWWMPTTHEFGPNGSFDDYEDHKELATRFGASATYSTEDRFAELGDSPDNSTIRLTDSLNLFEKGALAPDVTIDEGRYRLASLDAGIKYRGVFVGFSYYQRWLDRFRADGPLLTDSVIDRGFYLQAAFYPVKKKIEMYGATSWIFGDKHDGFQTEHEYLGGANWFFSTSRDLRVNAQMIRVDRSPVSSTFGYYVGGQKGMTVALAVSINF